MHVCMLKKEEKREGIKKKEKKCQVWFPVDGKETRRKRRKRIQVLLLLGDLE